MPKKKSRLSYSYKIKHNHRRQILTLEKNDEFKSQESARKFIENALSDIQTIHAEVDILKEQLMEVVCQTISIIVDKNRTFQTVLPANNDKNKKFVCSFCSKRFGTSIGLTIHQRQHANDSNEFKCHVCNQLFDSYSLISTHYFNIHSFQTENQAEEIIDEDFERSIRELDYLDSQKCQVCAKTYLTLKLYRSHVILRHNDNKDLMKYFTFICLQCNKLFVSRMELESHWNIRCYERWKEGKTEEEKNVVCEKCGMKFTSSEKLTSHFQIFHGEIIVEEKSDIIDTTRQIDTTEKLFQCKFCDYRYATEKETVAHHRSFHKKYVCKICGEISPCGKISKAHRKSHSQYLPSDTPSVCELCGKSFKSYVSLYMHKYYIHRGKIYACDICGKETNNPFALKTHKLIHDDWKGFGCSICGKRFKTKTEGCSHRKTHKNEIAQILIFSKDSPEVKVMPSKKIVNSKPVIISVKSIQDLQVKKDTCDNLEISERSTACLPSLPEEYSNPASPEFQNSPEHDYSVEDESGQNQYALITTSTVSEPIVNTNRNNSTCSLPLDCPHFFLTDPVQLGGANKPIVNSSSTVEVHPETVPTGNTLNGVEQPTLEDSIKKNIEQQNATFEYISVQSCSSNFFNEESESVEFEDNRQDLEYETKETLIPVADESEVDIKKVVIKTEKSGENTSLNSNRFPLDPFTPQLILKLKKLKEFNCIPCEKTIFYSNYSEIRSHRRKHRNTVKETNVSEDEDNFNCTLCPEIFENKKDLSHHKSKHHPKPKKVRNKKKLEGFYRCSQCEANFSWGTHLTAHCLKEHTGIRCFQCEICLIKCFTHKLLNGHKEKVHFKKKPPPPRPETKEYMCEICGKAFYTPRLVKMHIMFVHSERKFGCDICGKSFKVAKHLKMHKNRHTGIKPFVCEHCGKSFYENKELTDHLNSHHYKIDTRKAYKEKQKEIRKIQKITGVKIINTTKKHNFSCNICSKTFIKESGLTNHLKMHEPDRKYACDICGLRFKFSSNHRLHTEKLHKKKSE